MVKRLALAFAFSLFAMATGAEASVRVSCTENNVLVHREDVSSENLDRRRTDIANRHPGAMCVFLGAPTAPSHGEMESPDHERGNRIDAELITALAAISSNAPLGRIGEFLKDDKPQDINPAANVGTKSNVGIAIGIYDDVPFSTILSHWRMTSAGSSRLARLTPTISSAGNIMMLSLDDVRDEDVADVCKEIEERGLRCISVY